MHGKRTWPKCPTTGKSRFRERKDAKQTLRYARKVRSRAEIQGVTTTWTADRAYRCPFCHGWHLTSRPARQTMSLQLLAA